MTTLQITESVDHLHFARLNAKFGCHAIFVIFQRKRQILQFFMAVSPIFSEFRRISMILTGVCQDCYIPEKCEKIAALGFIFHFRIEEIENLSEKIAETLL